MQMESIMETYSDALWYGSNLALGMWKYVIDFMEPSLNAQGAFLETELNRFGQKSEKTGGDGVLELLRFNNDLANRAMTSALGDTLEYQLRFHSEMLSACRSTLFPDNKEDLAGFYRRKRNSLNLVLNRMPRAIQDIEEEYGLQFDTGGYLRIDETERFILYQVLPLNRKVETREDGKPVPIIPPYVLGPHILAILPGEQRSYVHSFADQGVPTYIRIVKDIRRHPAVQTMTGEDDTLDCRHFCELLRERHAKPVTLNGFCQGGFLALCSLLSGKLDGLVDALITCVAPMDGTRSPSFSAYLDQIPSSYKDLEYAMKTLPNGNRVIDGKIMSWIYRLKSIEKENPLTTFYRDMSFYEGHDGRPAAIPKIAAAIHRWLSCDRTDLPVAITRMSYDSYTRPVDEQGNLPISLFGRTLNFRHIKEKSIHFLIAYAETDDLITRETALAPLDYICAEVTLYPKGHGGIATSWSVPTSKCAHHTWFLGESGRRKHRGVVRYHLDLENGEIKPIERREKIERRKTRTFTRYDNTREDFDKSQG